ncbi:uncharacterized protein BYT42DRAFT_575286 [Radiomyces spectabilis]|uniref:uncharacterized protein n=1 Tax=Radiomyces spectabilis TaxID=64574 RepID=UPI00221FC08F|nr:uncharacterized protein BYT42DRAFT_575286 [Radiomyces spectabilis]KAI8374146.1 hypothetical protein BYT42DRAFT_575286 [Radiomyces spectabilis]
MSEEQRMQYDYLLHSAKNKFQKLQSIDDRDWHSIPIESISDKHAVQLYQCTTSAFSDIVFKVVCNLSTEKLCMTPNAWKSILWTVDMRNLWNPMVERCVMVHQSDQKISRFQVHLKEDWPLSSKELSCLESIMQSKSSLKFYSIMSSALPLTNEDDLHKKHDEILMGYDIRFASLDDTTYGDQLILYYQLPSRYLSSDDLKWWSSYVLSLVRGPLGALHQHGAPPTVSAHDPSIVIQEQRYVRETCQWNLDYSTQSNIDNGTLRSLSNSINIRRVDMDGSQANARSPQSRSWDYGGTSAPAMLSAFHRNSFMASSVMHPYRASNMNNHVAETSASLFINGKSSSWAPPNLFRSHSFGERLLEEKDKDDTGTWLLIEIDTEVWCKSLILDLDVQIDLENSRVTPDHLADRFAQSCIRYYHTACQMKRVFLAIRHPFHLAQYLRDELAAIDDDLQEVDDDEPVTVHLKLQTRTDQTSAEFKLFFRGVEHKLELSPLKEPFYEDDDNIDAIDETTVSDKDDASDVFVDGMEDLGPASHVDDAMTSSSTATSKPASIGDAELPSTESPLMEMDLSDSMIVPETEPDPILKAYNYFSLLNHADDLITLQTPDSGNGYVSTKKRTVEDHLTDVIICEAVWEECNIWDAKAVIECEGARRIWDSSFESSIPLKPVSVTCSLWHTKSKGSWLASARDYILFLASYTSTDCIDLCATSCPKDAYHHRAVPQETSGLVRAHLDLSAWRFKTQSSRTITVKHVLQSDPRGWIPSYLLNKWWSHVPESVHAAKQFLKRFGAPPNLLRLDNGKLVNLVYDHPRRHWRCEYVRSSEIPSSETNITMSTISEIRLAVDRWAPNGNYTITIDPPPSRVFTAKRVEDSFGILLKIEHEEEFIIPQRGRILVMIKRSHVQTKPGIVVNGAVTHMQAPPAASSAAQTLKNAVISALPVAAVDEVALIQKSEVKGKSPPIPPDTLTISATERAQQALLYLKKLNEPFGWITVSNKNGIATSKRPGTKAATKGKTTDGNPLDNMEVMVPDPFVIYKSSKVIECFSTEEIASVITDAGKLRIKVDEALEELEVLNCSDRHCHLLRQTVKTVFPFKSRDAFVVSCQAHEQNTSIPNISEKRFYCAETSLSYVPTVKDSKRQRAHVFISGWILEMIDPYTTTDNHPIPSTRVTYIIASDLGPSIPSYVSNMVNSNYVIKRVQALESYLKTYGPAPCITQPVGAIQMINGQSLLASEQDYEDLPILCQHISTTYDPSCQLLKVSENFQVRTNMQPSSLGVHHSVDELTLTSSHGSAHSTKVDMRTHEEPTSKLRAGTAPRLQRKTSNESATSGNDVRSTSDVTPVLTNCVLDMQQYRRGYEVQVALYCRSRNAIESEDISHALSVYVAELAPDPSHSIANTDRKPSEKHTIQINVNPRRLKIRHKLKEDSPVSYELVLKITPVDEERYKLHGMKLTVSGILNEANDQWDGVVFVNGREITLGTDMAVGTEASSTQSSPLEDEFAEDEKSLTNENHEKDGFTSQINDVSLQNQEASNTTQYTGSTMMSAALTVSANVYNGLDTYTLGFIRSHLYGKSLESSSPSVPAQRPVENPSANIGATAIQESDEEYRLAISSPTASTPFYETSTMKRTMMMIIICLCMAIVMGLLLLQPMVQNLISSMPDDSVFPMADTAVRPHYWFRLPLFREWEIHLIAVRRT